MTAENRRLHILTRMMSVIGIWTKPLRGGRLRVLDFGR